MGSVPTNCRGRSRMRSCNRGRTMQHKPRPAYRRTPGDHLLALGWAEPLLFLSHRGVYCVPAIRKSAYGCCVPAFLSPLPFAVAPAGRLPSFKRRTNWQEIGPRAGTYFTDARWKRARGIEPCAFDDPLSLAPLPHRGAIFRLCALRWTLQRGGQLHVCSADRGLRCDE